MNVEKPTPAPSTPFAQYSHPQLYAMLQAGDEKTARAAADSWDAVGARMHEQASNLEGKLATFKQHWQGGAAEQYQVMVGDLSGGLRKIADVALRMRDLTHDAADALVKAKKEMPAPVPVPDMSAATLRMATTPLEVSPFMPANQATMLQQQQTDAVFALQQHQQAAQASNSAHAKAVAVMTELAGHYQAADQSIPRTPAGGSAPGVPGQHGLGQQPLIPLPGQDVEQPTGKPVFGNMFTAGLAAAAVAGTGRLGTPLLPKVPPWATKKKEEQQNKTPDPKTGGLSGKGIGGGGAVGGSSPPPTPQAGVIGGAGGATGAAAAMRAVAGAAGAAGGMGTGMPMMPFMPMAPGAGDMAGARRIPPWLMETEEVWGQSATITPSVVGEDPPEENQPGGYQF